MNSSTRWRWLRWTSVGVYLVLCVLIIAARPGYHYDEALLTHGAVYMSTGATTPPPFAIEQGSWIQAGGRFWPLMIMSYVGAVKDPLLSPFGGSPYFITVARALAALMGAIGIAGIGLLAARLAGEQVGAFTTVIAAVHPSYVAQNVLDYGTVAQFMFAFGLCAASLALYLKRPSALAGLAMGLSAGLGIWARFNFLWVLAAAFAGTLVILRRRALLPWTHAAALIAGLLIALTPWLTYQMTSNWSTFHTLSSNLADEKGLALPARRVALLANTVFTDGEMRQVWDGPRRPAWAGYVYLGLIALATAVAIRSSSAFVRCAAATLLFLTAILVFAPQRVSPHHMVTAIPLIALVVATAVRGRICLWMAIAYVGIALWLNATQIHGIAETGGVGNWSDAIFDIAHTLENRYKGRPVQILDWGLQNNLYVISNGRILSTETFWAGAAGVTNAPGLYLLHAEKATTFPAAGQEFRRKLPANARVTSFRQRDGQPFADLIEILP